MREPDCKRVSHFRVGTLNGVQLDAVGVAARVYRRYAAAAETDAIVITAHNDNFIAFLRFLSDSRAWCHSPRRRQHNHFVVSIFRRSPDVRR